MRADATAERIEGMLRAVGRRADSGARAYLAGGATAVLYGWRDSTRDVDVRVEGPDEGVLRAIATLKDTLDINIELAGPLDFLPAPQGWQERAILLGRYGNLTVYHTPLELQALAKLQRGFDQDLADVDAMLARGLTSAADIAGTFDAVCGELYRFPSVDAQRLQAAVTSLSR
ncbi:MAG: DUF6036 family nucleotidyltransferase [Solirubrobacteraceae bacterium]